MPVLLVCSCGKQLQVQDELIGKNVRCPACKVVIEAQPTLTLAPVPIVDKVRLRCGRCGMEMQTSAANRGRDVACPGCKSAVMVPPEILPSLPPLLPATDTPQLTLETLHPQPGANQQTLATCDLPSPTPPPSLPETKTREAPPLPPTLDSLARRLPSSLRSRSPRSATDQPNQPCAPALFHRVNLPNQRSRRRRFPPTFPVTRS